MAKKPGYELHRHSVAAEDEGQVEAEALTGPSPGTDDSVQGVPIRKLGTPVSVVTGEDLEGAANPQCRRRTSQSAGCRGQFIGWPRPKRLRCGSAVRKVIRPSSSSTALKQMTRTPANSTSPNLSADDIERIEVLRGVQSGLIWLPSHWWRHQHHHQGRQRATDVSSRERKAGASEPETLQAASPPETIAAILPRGINFQEADGFNIAPETGNEKDGFERQTFNVRSGADSIVEGIQRGLQPSTALIFPRSPRLLTFSRRTSCLRHPFDVGQPRRHVDIWLGGGKAHMATI